MKVSRLDVGTTLLLGCYEAGESVEPDRTIEYAMEKIRKKKAEQSEKYIDDEIITNTGLEPEPGMEDIGHTTLKEKGTDNSISVPLVEMEWRYDEEDCEQHLYYKQNRAVTVNDNMVILQGKWRKVPYKNPGQG